MRAAQEREFVDFVRDASPRLLTTAWMLTGDPHQAEKLVQEALARVYVRWPKVRTGTPLAYTRRVVTNLIPTTGASTVARCSSTRPPSSPIRARRRSTWT